MIKKKNLKKTVGIVLVLFFVVSGVNGSTISWEENSRDSALNKSVVNDEKTVWWNTTNPELNPEPYTAPFFEVYELANLGNTAFGLDTADFNKDNLLDIAVGWWNIDDPQFHHGGISVFYRNSKNSFKTEKIYLYEWGISYLDVADFDNDGYEDILFSQYEEEENTGDGFFHSVHILWNDEGTFENKSHISDFRKADDWHNPHFTTADFDNDGDIDFIVGANCGKVKLFKNDGKGVFTDQGVIFDYGDNSWGLDVADFNDDGYPDFIVCARTVSSEYPFGDSGHIYLKLNDQTDSCFNSTSPGLLISSLPLPIDDTAWGAYVFGSVAVLDYNNDGLLDVIYGGDYKIFLFIQQENGSFHPFYAFALRDREFTWSNYVAQGGFTVADFNDDGYDDVVVGGTGGNVRLLINNQTFLKIVKPVDRWRYIFGEPKFHLKFPGMKQVIGDIEVVVDGLEPLSRVDFYLDDTLVHSDDTEPFSWNWTRFGFMEYKVAAEAYDLEGNSAGFDTARVWKFL